MTEAKPFRCSRPGCGLTFANEDHLVVHRNKHGLRLDFGTHPDVTSSETTGSPRVFFASSSDQTPTPTKFFRLDEGHLFEEIPRGSPNPFEEQFKRELAGSCGGGGAGGSNSNSVSSSSKETQSGKDDAISATDSVSRSASLSSNDPFGNIAVPDVPFPSPSLQATQPSFENLRSVVQMPLRIVSQPATSRTLVFLEIPGKGKVPFVIPGPNVVQEMSPESVVSQRSDDPNPPVLTSTNNYTLKEPPDSFPSKASVADSKTTNEDTKSDGAKRRASGNSAFEDENDDDDDDDPRDRRQRLLERNRVAASRSRLKRKAWIAQLETNCHELTVSNENLQKETETLKAELAACKALLKEHWDAGCHVSRIQAAQGRWPSDLGGTIVAMEHLSNMTVISEDSSQIILLDHSY